MQPPVFKASSTLDVAREHAREGLHEDEAFPMTRGMMIDDVADEYQYLRAQTCEQCGFKGTYDVQMQKLVDIDGKPHDILECRCTECGAEKEFTFDVSTAFARYDDLFKQPRSIDR
jgi:hypothetical protein